MARVVILTGGNVGDVKACLQHAQIRLNECVGAVLHCSHRYESQPWGFVDASAGPFSNQVLELSTDLSPEQVLDAVQQIEQELGRDRAAEQQQKLRSGQPYSSRKIDIDILFYDDLVLNTPRLTLPHPHLSEREFVLLPLCELMRTRRDPVSGRTMGELLEELKQRNEK